MQTMQGAKQKYKQTKCQIGAKAATLTQKKNNNKRKKNYNKRKDNIEFAKENGISANVCSFIT
jgi:hypothetical protein